MASPRSEANIRILVCGWLLVGLAFALVGLDGVLSGGLDASSELRVAAAQQAPGPAASAVADGGVTCVAATLGAVPASCGPGNSGRAATTVSAAAKRLVERHCSPSPNPLFCFYTVARGDSLSEIAESFGLKTGAVSGTDILRLSNAGTVSDAASILVGQDLRIPTRQGVIVTVGADDTLSSIATAYGVSTIEIAAVDGNDIGAANAVMAGQDILVPNPRQAPRQPAATVAGGDEGSSSQ